MNIIAFFKRLFGRNQEQSVSEILAGFEKLVVSLDRKASKCGCRQNEINDEIAALHEERDELISEGVRAIEARDNLAKLIAG